MSRIASCRYNISLAAGDAVLVVPLVMAMKDLNSLYSSSSSGLPITLLDELD
jgi:hypothetical protein